MDSLELSNSLGFFVFYRIILPDFLGCVCFLSNVFIFYRFLTLGVSRIFRSLQISLRFSWHFLYPQLFFHIFSNSLLDFCRFLDGIRKNL